MKILWNSDRIMGTSAYSRVTYEACTRLAKMGHQVAHVPMGRANRMGKWGFEGVLLYQSGSDPFNEDVVVDHYVDWKADVLVTLKDVWCFSRIPDMAINWVPYVPVDHSPISPSITSKLGIAFKIITPSRHGQRELKQAGFESAYVPHGVRSDVFRPLDKAKCKKLWFLAEDDFTVLFIGRNQSRKLIPRVLKAYKLFRERNPDIKSHLMLWTDVQPPMPDGEGAVGLGVADVGVNLLPEIISLDLGEVVMWPDAKLVREGLPDLSGPDGYDMVKLYNAADVVLSLSGEGAWLPGIEAQSCGVPVICADYASAPEVCGAGYTIPYDDYVILNTPGTRYPLCSLDVAADCLARIANGNREKFAKKARAFAERFDWSNVMELYWKPFLDGCEAELKPLFTKEGVKSW